MAGDWQPFGPQLSVRQLTARLSNRPAPPECAIAAGTTWTELTGTAHVDIGAPAPVVDLTATGMHRHRPAERVDQLHRQPQLVETDPERRLHAQQRRPRGAQAGERRLDGRPHGVGQLRRHPTGRARPPVDAERIVRARCRRRPQRFAPRTGQLGPRGRHEQPGHGIPARATARRSPVGACTHQPGRGSHGVCRHQPRRQHSHATRQDPEPAGAAAEGAADPAGNPIHSPARRRVVAARGIDCVPARPGTDPVLDVPGQKRPRPPGSACRITSSPHRCG